MNGTMNALQLIAMAGGLTPYAKGKGITIIRPGVPEPIRFNYDEIKSAKTPRIVELKVGDTIVVP
jgi:hypothetical protein